MNTKKGIQILKNYGFFVKILSFCIFLLYPYVKNNYQRKRVTTLSPELQNVINWFLSKDSMSPKKLQKLLYYAYSWTLTLENEDSEELENRLFEEDFEAWVHGPVIPDVYFEYRNYGYQNIPKKDFSPDLPEEIEDILEQVWEEYGEFTGNELETITHKEDPWRNARKGYNPIERCNEKISDIDIFNYYIQQVEYID
ncbi:Panacea domain-containing protein [Evansella clarkii]|uniref:Panacea domain-containing protein n=1 Tax=Evansella clarkii TaxID=79879 RepID=UPI0009981E26|nr:type II toxin-antitoxin system antitoxin SocA domain-containing protein [Evansella clarkii]